MQFLDLITQRKTVKLFDKEVKIPRTELEEMIRLAQLAPSKTNLQPWRFVAVDDETQKSQLAEFVAFNGPPSASAAAVILILADLQYDKLLETILDVSIENGCLHPNFRTPSIEYLTKMHQSLSQQQIRDQVLIDASLAAMQLMLVVKEKGFDSHAIGIFDQQAVLNLLKVDSERYAPVMLLAIGKAATPALPSARLPLDYTLRWNSAETLAEVG